MTKLFGSSLLPVRTSSPPRRGDPALQKVSGLLGLPASSLNRVGAPLLQMTGSKSTITFGYRVNLAVSGLKQLKAMAGSAGLGRSAGTEGLGQAATNWPRGLVRVRRSGGGRPPLFLLVHPGARLASCTCMCGFRKLLECAGSCATICMHNFLHSCAASMVGAPMRPGRDVVVALNTGMTPLTWLPRKEQSGKSSMPPYRPGLAASPKDRAQPRCCSKRQRSVWGTRHAAFSSHRPRLWDGC